MSCPGRDSRLCKKVCLSHAQTAWRAYPVVNDKQSSDPQGGSLQGGAAQSVVEGVGVPRPDRREQSPKPWGAGFDDARSQYRHGPLRTDRVEGRRLHGGTRREGKTCSLNTDSLPGSFQVWGMYSPAFGTPLPIRWRITRCCSRRRASCSWPSSCVDAEFAPHAGGGRIAGGSSALPRSGGPAADLNGLH